LLSIYTGKGYASDFDDDKNARELSIYTARSVCPMSIKATKYG
jgi:hypothetical protein